MTLNKSIFKIDPVWGVLVCVFVWKMAPDVVWKDSGEMIAASFALGAPHGSGYVPFVLLARAFSFLPLGSVATRIALLNAAGGAALLSLLTLTVVRIGEAPSHARKARAAFAGMMVLWLGTRRTWLAEAGGTENSLLFFLLLFGTISLIALSPPPSSGAAESRRASSRGWAFAFVLMGLAGAYHPLALAGLPFAAIACRSQGTSWRTVSLQVALGLMAAAAPVLFVFVRSGAGVGFEWGDRQTIGGWWQAWKDYGRIHQVVWPGWDVLDWLRILGAYLSEFFPGPSVWIVAVLSAAGIPDIRRLGRWSSVLVFGLLAASAIAVLVNAGQERSGQSLMLPILMALLAARGSFRLAALTVSHQHRVVVGTAAVMAFPTVIAMAHASPLRATSGAARRYAERLAMESLPGAILIVPTSQAHFVLREFQVVENRRPDLVLVNESSLPLQGYTRHLLGEARRGSPPVSGIVLHFLDARPIQVNSIASITKLAGLGYVPRIRSELEGYSFLGRGLTFQVTRIPHSESRTDPEGGPAAGEREDGHKSIVMPDPRRMEMDEEGGALWRDGFFNLAVYFEILGKPDLQEACLVRAAGVAPSDRMARFALDQFRKKKRVEKSAD